MSLKTGYVQSVKGSLVGDVAQIDKYTQAVHLLDQVLAEWSADQ